MVDPHHAPEDERLAFRGAKNIRTGWVFRDDVLPRDHPRGIMLFRLAPLTEYAGRVIFIGGV